MPILISRSFRPRNLISIPNLIILTIRLPVVVDLVVAVDTIVDLLFCFTLCFVNLRLKVDGACLLYLQVFLLMRDADVDNKVFLRLSQLPHYS